MLSRPVEVPEAGAWAVARRSLGGDLPLRYQRTLQFEFDQLVDQALGSGRAGVGSEPGLNVLDVGSGRRPCVAVDHRPAGCAYVGLDISAGELQAAPPGSYDRFVVSDVSDRAADLGGQFDLVLSFQVLEHVRPLDAAFENLRHYLKPGGRLIAQFSGGLSAFGLLGRAVPNRLSRPVLHHLLHRDPEKVFPAHYDHCWASAVRRMLVPWTSAEVTPLHRGASYFHFARPLRAGYLLFEEWVRSQELENLASYYIVDAVR